MTTHWPETPSADIGAETARKLALNLKSVLNHRGLSARAASTLTGVDHTVIGKVLNGNTWPDLRTISLLEHGLNTVLWPARTAQGEPDISQVESALATDFRQGGTQK